MDALKKKQRTLIKMMPPLDKVIRGTFREYYLTCGTKSCHCHRDKRHGPYAYLGITEKDKTRMRRVPESIKKEIKQGVRFYNLLWRIITELSEVNLALIWRRVKEDEA